MTEINKTSSEKLNRIFDNFKKDIFTKLDELHEVVKAEHLYQKRMNSRLTKLEEAVFQ